MIYIVFGDFCLNAGEPLFQKSLKSISLLFKYMPGLTVLKLLQISLSAVLAPLSIYFTAKGY
ncbi:MAG: hypothetical protein LBL96_11610 [Clostridiales bacterium]|nr:hypothetical protein [Clostridiales bacterium]